MRGRPSPAEALVTLVHQPDAAERRACWRQVVTAIGQQSSIDGPPSLDDVPPSDLLAAARVVLDTRLVDDLDWIAAGPAAVALYELTTALPAGPERREFGKRVFQRVYGGTAGAFVSVATRMAWSSVKQLETRTMRARVGLCFSLPIGSSVNADPLALALVVNRDRFHAWVAQPSLGPLPARRLAAVLLERAAREAVRRAQLGDPYPSEWLKSRHVRPTHERLLSDREPLVWRHASIARGILAAAEPHIREEIELLLDPGLSPTEWRRAVVSLVACLAHDYDGVMPQLKSLLRSELVRRHPGLVATFIWGLGPIIEADPEVAEELLEELSQIPRPDVAEALADLLSDTTLPTFGARAMERLRKSTETHADSEQPFRSFGEGTRRGLEHRVNDGSITNRVLRALVAYETIGAVAARDVALEAMELAHHTMDQLEILGGKGNSGLAECAPLLSDLDSGVLQRARLYDLLLLGRRPGDANAPVPQIESLFDRLGGFVLRSEAQLFQPEPWSPNASTVRRKRMVAFLHLLDVQSGHLPETQELAERIHGRIRDAVRMLLRSLAENRDPSVHRVLCATLARSLDAAAREGVADPSELLLVLMNAIDDPISVRALVEGSTDPDVRAGLSSYSTFLDLLTDEGSQDESRHSLLARGLLQFSRSLGIHGAYRGEAVRQCLLRIGRALDAVAHARSLGDLAHHESGSRNWTEELAHFGSSLALLGASAERRLLARAPADLRSPPDALALSELVGRAASALEQVDPEALNSSIAVLTAGIARPVSQAVSEILARLSSLPASLPSDISIIPLKARRIALPDWLLPRRTIGGFYVIRALGAGGVSSVFVAKRVEDRRDDDAELYALKVPQYDPTTARSLSEQEFMEMFRDEAGALLSLPKHPNLARFVNFDVAAKPRPILVMELICGQSVEKLVRSRAVTTPTAFQYLDGILAGLAAMHAVGVAHLDVKPSNVILRDEHTAVLVDFGLSGRQLRPGCGTLEYCAPEVLGVVPEGYTPHATMADMYAFGCTAYELITGNLLFDADNEMALMSQHVSHDGWPPRLLELAQIGNVKGLAVILAACLRRDPRARPTADATRIALRTAVQKLGLAAMQWPLGSALARSDKSA
jgi:eukaryotic-like serine/threonine-protein kinase